MSLVQKKILFSLIIGLIVLVLFGWLAIFPLLGKIRIAAQEYSSNQETLLKIERKEMLVRKLEKEYQEKHEDLLKVEKAFLAPEEAVGFIYTLEKLAQKTNNIFEIKTVSPFSSSKGKSASFISFQISLWGDFYNMLSFISHLENNPYPPYRLIEIESLAARKIIDTSKKDDKGCNMETILNIKIHTQNPAEL